MIITLFLFFLHNYTVADNDNNTLIIHHDVNSYISLTMEMYEQIDDYSFWHILWEH